MNFAFTEEQEELRSFIRSFMRKRLDDRKGADGNRGWV